MKSDIKTLELLAPAKDYDTAVAAIRHGADAVYIGGPAFGARAAAGNSMADIARLCDYAHRFGVKVYVTLNTIIYDSELAEVRALVGEYYRIGVDALIVQDMALLQMALPPIALHASTQCDTRTASKAAMLAAAGFSQIVVARELSLTELGDIAAAVPSVAIEAFVHGALCVCYSGDCQASYVTTGRSANRGECAQICRLAYDLVDGQGRVISAARHFLSLKDMCRLDHLQAMIDAGVSSFKIEGRLKDAAYVKNVVAAYSQALDAIVAASSGRYVRASSGRVAHNFEPDVAKSFNRGFTDYFLTGQRRRPGSLANLATPKWVGESIATVLRRAGKRLEVKYLGSRRFANGDGIGYFDAQGRFCGVRINRAEADSVFLAQEAEVPKGAKLYRNADKEWLDTLSRSDDERRLRLDMELRAIGGNRGIALRLRDERGSMAEVVEWMPLTAATAGGQQQQRRRVLERLGNTIYRAGTIEDYVGDVFVAASVLTALRRRALVSLERASRATYAYDYRRAASPDLVTPQTLTRHDNVANAEAAAFYLEHGTRVIERAIEVAQPATAADVRVMTTRYCLRREMGACLRDKATADTLPRELYLRAPIGDFRLDFDCRNCEMHLLRSTRLKEMHDK